MRIAWVGPTPSAGGGAPGVGGILIGELSRLGVEVDCFIAAPSGDVIESLRRLPGVSFIHDDTGWRWGRWYSRHPILASLSGNASRIRGQRRLAGQIAARHRERPYDLVYQFSQIELAGLRPRLRELPPVVIHPSTHAAGELRWHRAEAHLGRRCEPAPKRALVRAILVTRAGLQRRDLRRARRVLGVSAIFCAHLARDYGVPADRLGVVPNPIDLGRFEGRLRVIPPSHPLELVFVSRMSARKGVEMVVDLSHRLADLAGRARIRVIGDYTSWSDYRCLLSDLEPSVAAYEGVVSHAQLAAVSDCAIGAIQPSRYEPFGLTVAEALASGLPVVASSEIGAAAGVDPRVCRVFPAGDADAFERSVRTLVAEVEATPGTLGDLSALARAEAVRLFSPGLAGRTLLDELARALAAPPRGTSRSQQDLARPRR